VNGEEDNAGIVIDCIRKEYLVDYSLLEYLGMPMGVKRISKKKKFLKVKIQKVMKNWTKLNSVVWYLTKF
jgi:hypothetical protein